MASRKCCNWWVWVIVIALAWGGWQKHRATSAADKHLKAVAEAAAERETKIVADAQETARRLQTQKGIADAAQQKAKALATDVANARTAEQRLLDKLAAIEAIGGGANTAPADGSPPAGQTAGVLADLLSRMGEAGERISRYADEVKISGQACENIQAQP